MDEKEKIEKPTRMEIIPRLSGTVPSAKTRFFQCILDESTLILYSDFLSRQQKTLRFYCSRQCQKVKNFSKKRKTVFHLFPWFKTGEFPLKQTKFKKILNWFSKKFIIAEISYKLFGNNYDLKRAPKIKIFSFYQWQWQWLRLQVIVIPTH